MPPDSTGRFLTAPVRAVRSSKRHLHSAFYQELAWTTRNFKNFRTFRTFRTSRTISTISTIRTIRIIKIKNKNKKLIL